MRFIPTAPSLRDSVAIRLTVCMCVLLVPSSIVHAASTVQQTIRAADVSIDVIPKSGPGLDAAPGSAAGDLGEIPGLAASDFESPANSRGTGFSWTLQIQNSAVYTDLSMSDATHGFASAELGQVYRTTDGSTWTQILNLGFPHYWYGVHAFDPSTVFISGFQNQTGDGIGRWSTDGGATWTNDLIIDPDNWLTINQFADRDHGIATAIGSGFTYFTQNGGATAADWTRVLADPTQGWFAGNFTFRENLQVYVTGISFCTSSDGGMSYARRPSIDPVFDGGVSFPDAMHGWTGGGQISAPVQGWVHRTTDGGATWSGRILNPPYPIRSLLFFDENLGFAVGGNYFGAVGGIWSTTDGGTLWINDVDTGCEMKGIDWARVDSDSVSIWCAGSRSGVGRIYRTTIYHPETPSSVAELDHPGIRSIVASPNPFRESVQIDLEFAARSDDDTAPGGPIGVGAAAMIEIVDVSGRTIRRLAVETELRSGASRVTWDGRDESGEPVSAGIYYAKAGGQSARLACIR